MLYCWQFSWLNYSSFRNVLYVTIYLGMTANLWFKKPQNASIVVCVMDEYVPNHWNMGGNAFIPNAIISKHGTPVPFKVKNKSNLSSKDLSINSIFEYQCQFSVKRWLTLVCMQEPVKKKVLLQIYVTSRSSAFAPEVSLENTAFWRKISTCEGYINVFIEEQWSKQHLAERLWLHAFAVFATSWVAPYWDEKKSFNQLQLFLRFVLTFGCCVNFM